MAAIWLKIIGTVVMTLYYSLLAIGSVALDRSGTMYHGIARTWARHVLGVFGVQVHLKGLENLEQGKTYVFVSNHASMFDIPAVIASIPFEVRIVYKKELSYVPVWGWALAVWGYALAWFLVNDQVKLAAYRILDPHRSLL